MSGEGLVIEGVVTEGRRLGRKLGFPTANLSVPEGFAAEDGVYASWAETEEGMRYRAMSNLGRNPSVGETERRLETHLFGFEGSLYGQRLRVELGCRIRSERTFASLEELQAQIARDRAEILALGDAGPAGKPGPSERGETEVNASSDACAVRRR